jgi:hypothetical protein
MILNKFFTNNILQQPSGSGRWRCPSYRDLEILNMDFLGSHDLDLSDEDEL